jgi:hypothetical protein
MDYLEGDALTWYTSHVLSAKRAVQHWTFCDVIIGLYDRYILPTSMQDARDSFRKVRYAPAIGVQGFIDALLEHAQNMAVYPDEYTILEEFVKGLPPIMRSRYFREHRITVEANSLEDWVAAAREIERCDRNETYYTDMSKSRATTSQTKDTHRSYGSRNTRWGSKKVPERNSETKAPEATQAKGQRVSSSRDKAKATPYPRRPFDKSKGQTRPTDKPRTQEVACFRCGGNHYAYQCTQKTDRREFVRAARTTVGVAEEEMEKGSQSMESDDGDERSHGDHRSADDRHDEDDQEENESNVIEVTDEDFFEGLNPYTDYVTSLHAFPLSELRQRTEEQGFPTTESVAKGKRELDRVQLATQEVAEQSETLGIPVRKKYQLHHTGKTRMRPVVPPEAKECLATWVTVGDLKAWTLWDSGSTTTGITPTFAEHVRVKVDTLEDPHVL